MKLKHILSAQAATATVLGLSSLIGGCKTPEERISNWAVSKTEDDIRVRIAEVQSWETLVGPRGAGRISHCVKFRTLQALENELAKKEAE